MCVMFDTGGQSAVQSELGHGGSDVLLMSVRHRQPFVENAAECRPRRLLIYVCLLRVKVINLHLFVKS